MLTVIYKALGNTFGMDFAGAFLELWLRMTFLKLWLIMEDEHVAIPGCAW